MPPFFGDPNVVDYISMVSSIDKAKLSGVVYRDITPVKDQKEFGVGRVIETDAMVSVLISNISGVHHWCPHEIVLEGSARPWASDPHTSLTAPP